MQNDEVTTTYLYGTNLLNTSTDDETSYYLFNAHGDVTGIADDAQTVTKTYDYDAFGNEKNPSATDTNPFRYCGEYYDAETGTYYLRARYYDPAIGRFTQQDTHWNTANMIYGDNPNKINEREDALGLKAYTYTPSISSIMQSGNLYVYCVNNPIYYCDYNGYWVETAFDIATLGVSIADVYNNPDDGWAWAGLIGDVIDLCPFVMGVGEVIKAKRVTGVIDDIGDSAKVAKKSDNIISQKPLNQERYNLNGAKNANYVTRRGWNDEMINTAIDNGAKGSSINLANGEKCTVYCYPGKSNQYIVIEDSTKSIVQVSNFNDFGWIPDSRIEWYR